MLKIYSIKEIIDASNQLLADQQEVIKEININEHVSVNKNNEMINSLTNSKKKIFIEKSIPKEIEGIILEAENSQKQIKIDKSANVSNQVNKNSFDEIKISKNDLVESMYKTFSKKIKKNTLKLIVELREEIIFLTKNISSLEKQKEQEQSNNKILKKDIADLTHIENQLKYNLEKIKTDFSFLKEQYKDLEAEHISLKEQYKNLDAEHISLKEQYKNLDAEHVSLKEQYKNLDAERVLLKNQTIFLRNDSIKINAQLNNYQNKELVLREKNDDLEKTIDDLKSNTNNNDQSANIIDLENKIKHYQDENIRISSEFTESNKKFEITRQSLSELQKHKGDLINKINSINEVIQDENIVTSVFHNDLEKDKINVIDTNKPAKTNKNDLDEKIKNIFIQD